MSRPASRAEPAAPRLHPDARLSRYVIETGPEGAGILYHTVSKVVLPSDADRATLRDAGFLAGQEEVSLRAALERDRTVLALTIVPTWECNLRCTHCTVLRQLVPRQEEVFPVERLVRFVERARAAKPGLQRLDLSFLGGEPLLAAERCLAVIERTAALLPELRTEVTTNLAVELGRTELDLLARIDAIVVSLDGLETLHNAQRHPYRARFNPFERTVSSLRRLVEEGLAERVWVQGAIRDEFATIENFREFHRFLMKLGVRWDRIRFETIHPAPHRPDPQGTYLDTLTRPTLREQPCCKFRGGSHLVIDPGGAVLSDFYDRDALGTLDDPPEAIGRRYQAMLDERMPALQDPVCRQCPVIGFCWGGCTSARPLVGERPSQHCAQERLVERVRELAGKGELVDRPLESLEGCARPEPTEQSRR
jgi:radical SAM protein with 4Fe4S-binding SPASM domain